MFEFFLGKNFGSFIDQVRKKDVFVRSDMLFHVQPPEVRYNNRYTLKTQTTSDKTSPVEILGTVRTLFVPEYVHLVIY